METRNIEAFITVAETLNFSAAAKRLYISQPAVTKQITKLEEELGYHLLIRNTRSVSLTPAGRSFYQTAKQLMAQLNIGIADAKNIDQPTRRTVTIGYEDNWINRLMLPKIVTELAQMTTEKIEIKLHLTSPNSNLEELLNEKIDILFLIQNSALGVSSVVYHELYQAPFISIVNRDSKLAANATVKLADLQNQRLLYLNPAAAPLEMEKIQQQFLKLINNDNYIYTDSALSACIKAAANQGIVAIIPDIIPPHLDAIKLLALDDQLPFNGVSFGMAMRKKDYQKPAYHQVFKRVVNIYQHSEKTISEFRQSLYQ